MTKQESNFAVLKQTADDFMRQEGLPTPEQIAALSLGVDRAWGTREEALQYGQQANQPTTETKKTITP